MIVKRLEIPQLLVYLYVAVHLTKTVTSTEKIVPLKKNQQKILCEQKT